MLENAFCCLPLGSGDDGLILDVDESQSTNSYPHTTNSLIEYKNNSDLELAIRSISPSSFVEPPSINLTNSPAFNQSINEWERRKTNANPSVDDIISGIIQLIGGNVKLSRPPLNVKLQQLNQHNLEHLMHATRINNRGPPKVSFVGPGAHHIPNLVPPSILIGPGRPAGLPLPLPPTHLAKLPALLNFGPTKPALNIPESDVSFLLGLLKSNHIKEEVQIVPIQTLPKVEISKPPTTLIEMTLTNNTVGVIPFQSETFSSGSSSSIKQDSSMNTPILPQSNSLSSPIILHTELLSNTGLSKIFSKESPNSKSIVSSISKLPTGYESNFTELTTKILLSEITTQASEHAPTGPVTAWVPLFLPPSLRTNSYQTEHDPVIITMPEEPSIFELTVKQQMGAKTDTTMPKIEPTPVVLINSHKQLFTSESALKHPNINSSISSSTATNSKVKPHEPEIVYGKPAPVKPIAPSFSTNLDEIITLSASGVMSTRILPINSTPKNKLTPLGRPIVIPVEMDEVRPYVAQTNAKPLQSSKTPSIITEHGKGSVYIDTRPTIIDVTKPINSVGSPTIQIGSGINVNGDSEILNDKHGKPLNSPSKPVIVRRPPFRPRPSVPLVRIDTCIVGDDSTCDASLNENCQTELGISSCQCRPGFARSLARTPCILVTSLALLIKVDRLNDKKLIFNRNFLNSNTEDYQYLEYESLQAINSAFSLSNLAKVFLGAKVNRFYSIAGKTIINATINLELNNATNSASIKKIVQQELSKVIAVRNNNIGDSQLWVEGSLNAIPRVDDINECSASELNDCSKFAKCINEFGTFRCQCETGYEDKFLNDKTKSGRHCTACSPQYCSNRGECFVINGQRECKCRGNFVFISRSM